MHGLDDDRCPQTADSLGKYKGDFNQILLNGEGMSLIQLVKAELAN